MSLIRARFVRGSAFININDTINYSLGQGFRPPPVLYSVNTAPGLAMNYYDGARLVGKKAQNRDLNFTIAALGTTEADVRAKIRRLNDFVNSGTEGQPVYLELRGNNNFDFVPKWGQEIMRYQVVEGAVYPSENYNLGSSRESILPDVQVRLTIRPFALGQEQRLASAKGGILEDTVGAANGGSRGVIVGSATTNKMTNPIFGHATYNNGWTFDTGVNGSENTNPEFVAFGRSSAKVTAISSSNNLIYQLIDAGNTNTHVFSCYVKKPDKSAVTSSDMVMRYAATNLTTTFISLGNGWYRAYATAAGVASVQAAAISVTSGKTVYVDQIDFVESAYLKPPVNGDMLGCSWSSTAHASTSVRAVGRMRLPFSSVIDQAGGTLRVVIKMPDANGAMGSGYIFDDEGSTELFRGFINANDTLAFVAGAASVNSSALTWAAGAVYVLHFVWGPANGRKIYVNGALNGDGSATAYTPNLAAATYLHIGAYETGVISFDGTYQDFTAFDREMTAGEIAADYANIAPMATAGERTGWIPYLWTKDGDDVLDNCDDSTRDNWAVVGSVPGSAPAETYYQLTPETVVGSKRNLWLGQHIDDWRYWLKPADRFYFEGESTLTSNADANASGGAYGASAGMPISTGADNSVYLADVPFPEALYGPFHLFVRIAHSAGTQDVGIFPYLQADDDLIIGALKTVSVSTTYAIYYAGRIDVAPWIHLPKGETPRSISIGVGVWGGTSGSLKVDYAMCVNGMLGMIDSFAGSYTHLPEVPLSAGNTSLVLQGRQIMMDGRSNYIGDVIELWPGRANTLTAIIGDDGGAHVITATTTFAKTIIIPRWAIL